MMVLSGVNLVHITFKNTRSVVDRTSLQAGERKDGGVKCLIAGKRLIFGATSRLITNQVGIGATQSRGANCLVSIHHDMMLGGFGHTIQIVVVHPLPVVMFSTWQNIAHISALH